MGCGLDAVSSVAADDTALPGDSLEPMTGARPPAQLRATVGQSMGHVHQPLTLFIDVEDTLGEHAPGFVGELEVALHGDSTAVVTLGDRVAFDGQVRQQLTFHPQEPGTAWIVVKDPSGSLASARSNPVWVRPTGRTPTGATSTPTPTTAKTRRPRSTRSPRTRR